MKPPLINDVRVPQNFIPKEVKEQHYKFGASKLPKKEIMKDGHGWKKFRPVAETQFKNDIDPQSCPAGATLNAYEHIGLALYKNKGFQSDLSERHLAILMGMTGTGGVPWDAFEKIHAYGAIPEKYLPFDKSIKTLKQYFSPRPISYSLFKIGLHWLTVYKPGAEWVITPYMNLTTEQKNARMKEALQYSVLGVAGYSWALHADGKYYNDGPDIHFFNIDDYTEGDSWDVFDTYEPYGKKLDWNYSPNWVIRYDLSRKLGAEETVFNSEDAAEAKIEYIKYLAKWFISQFIRTS